MRKPMIVTAAVLLMVLALAAYAKPPGGGITVESPGKATFGGTLQEPEITLSANSVTVDGA